MRVRAFAATVLLAGGLTLSLHATDGDLKSFVGKWKATLFFPEAGGRVTISEADDAHVTQLDQNTITFSLKPMGRDAPVFDTRLTYDAASKSYVLTVKSGHGLSVEKLRLTYAEPTGFSGEGTMTDLAGKTFAVQANITATAAGGYEWTVRDPKAPPAHSSVFRFWFDKRLK